MKHILVKTALLSLPTLLSAQEKENKTNLDTVKIYQCSYSRKQKGDAVTYEINNKEVTKEYYQKIRTVNKSIESCNPCYMKTYSLEDVLLEAGTLYYHCPAGKKEEPLELESKTGMTIVQKADFCKHGEWTYYNAKGKITRLEHYDLGKEIK